jgi:hypothetical protein
MAGFWSESALEPKRQYRWVLQFGAVPKWMIKSVDKPVATVSSQAHKYFGHTYNYPGTVTWNDINMTLVDPVEPDAVSTMATLLRQGGYNPPNSDSATLISISKNNAVASLGIINIVHLNAAGSAIETWSLTNPIFTSIDFGGNLSYENEGLLELKLTVKYDWAQLVTAGAPYQKQTVNGVSPGSTYWVPGQA